MDLSSRINGLDLFSGIGGLALALEPWVRPIAYCESDRYAQSVLMSNMQRRELSVAPIWDDVRTLRGNHMPIEVDIVYGGFPCQDISVAGNGAGLAGERSGLYFEIERLVEEIRPTLIFLENVPAIRTRGLGRVIKGLASLGYDCRWTIVSAAEVGAVHQRDRWFCLAAHADRIGSWDESGRLSGTSGTSKATTRNNGAQESLANAPRFGSDSWSRRTGRESEAESVHPFTNGWWATEPNVDRVVNGLPARVDRLRGLGNAVVPLQARTAFERLSGFGALT